MDIQINESPFPHFSMQFLSKEKASILRNEIL